MAPLTFGPPSMRKSQNGMNDDEKAIELLADNLNGDNRNRTLAKILNGDNNSWSSNNSRYKRGRMSNDEERNRDYQPAYQGVGCCGHLLILSLPILAMAFTLAFLLVLLVFDRSQIQNMDLYGDETVYEVADIYFGSISQDTISFIMSQYNPYYDIIILVSIACGLVSIVTVARNIQIEVYHQRTQSNILIKMMNYLSSTVNIASYLGLMVAVAFKSNQEAPTWASKAHYYGAGIFFAGTAVYAVLHSLLLCSQRHYPTVLKVLFFGLAVTIVTCSLLFVIPLWNDGLSEDGINPVYEWIAVFTTAIYVGFYALLFHLDSVDDELWQFFSGRSPYAVLELNQSNKNNGIVTKGDIRAAFRRLAKAYHPDLNRHSETARVEVLTKEECEAKMAELVEAYHILLDDDDDFAARFQVGHSNKVALACELYSLDELELDRFHDVYALEMDFGSGEGEDKSRDNQDEEQDQNGADEKGENHNFSADKEGSSSSSITTKSLVQTSSCKKRILVHAHPEDSVSDLKRQLEEDHGVEWGLRQPRHPNSRSADDSLERRKDRDGLSIGWELLVLRESSDDDSILDNIGTSCQDEERGSSSIHARNNGGGSATESTGVQNQVLSYHLFLDDYRIQHGETIFVVVRKHDA
ncbi:unnamed protein product [Pseudo-nitzschia multistriata]|uniref:J domain-containing protein n=1 Tax=Pseudo-nitzschia multistriata TaxID=183589 RepID=A0A448ZA02_9STRA|nr:unnamed protein product [Pseudo-nitzschia multistriata]